MTWLDFLSNVTAVVQITGNVVVLFYAFPAFQRTRRRGFVLIGAACLLGTFDTLCDHTVGQSPMPHDAYVLYRTARRFTFCVAVTLETVGMVLLIQGYLHLLPSRPAARPEDEINR